MNITRLQRLARCVAIGLPLLLAWPAHAETATLQYDNNGNVTQRTTPQGTTTYQYDALNRMTGESGPAKTQTITYDENGNRKSDGAGTYTIDPASNRMSTRLGLAVTFDAAGNLTADGTGRTFAYNQANQLYQVFQGGVLLATYTYDFTGLRIAKVTTASAPQGAQTVIYEYDEQEHLISEISGTGAPLRSYVWREDTPVAQIEYQPSRKILSFDPDHLNTPRAAMDETGKVVWRWESDAFGSTLPDEDPDGDGNKTTINSRFSGYYADIESGLFYAKHRYYSPLLGIFTQTDRLDLLRQAVNPLYAGYSEPTDLQRALNQPFNYAGNNPLTQIDPLGLANGPAVAQVLKPYTPVPPPKPPYPNGNYEAGFHTQDQICSFPASLLNLDKCSAQCCQQHDKCYKKHGCNASSWKGNYFGYTSAACEQCNAAAVQCIQNNFGKSNCNPENCSSK